MKNLGRMAELVDAHDSKCLVYRIFTNKDADSSKLGDLTLL